MAIFRPGALAGAISGAVGGVVFVLGKQGQVVRTRANPTRPGSARQTGQRAIYLTCCRGWRELLDEERLTWEVAARNTPYVDRFGKARYYSPFLLYMAANLRTTSPGYIPEQTYGGAKWSQAAHRYYMDFRPGGPFLISDAQADPFETTYCSMAAGRAFRLSAQRYYPEPPHLARYVAAPPDTNVYDLFCGRSGEPVSLEWVYARVSQRVSGSPLASVTRLVQQIPNEGPLLISNGDFEAAWAPPLAPYWARSETAVMTRYAPAGFGDVYGAQVDWPVSGAWSYVRTRVTPGVTGGVAYRLRFAIYVFAGTAVGVGVYAPPNGFSYLETIAATGAWVRKDYSYVPGATSTEAWVLFAGGYLGASKCWLDNVDFRKAA